MSETIACPYCGKGSRVEMTHRCGHSWVYLCRDDAGALHGLIGSAPVNATEAT